jgi:hypothetical protein
VYGDEYVGGDESVCLHFQCGSSTTNEYKILSVAQVKKTYGQGKAAKLALGKTRTAYGPRKFGNAMEVVLVKEFVANLVAAGGNPTPKPPKASKAAISKKKLSMKQMKQLARFL